MIIISILLIIASVVYFIIVHEPQVILNKVTNDYILFYNNFKYKRKYIVLWKKTNYLN